MRPLREISLKRNVQIGPMAALRDVKGLMRKNRLTTIPAVKDNELIGMVSLDQVFEHSSNRLVCDAMAKGIVAIQVDSSLDEALKLMKCKNLDTIPVLDGKKLVGLITIQEIVKELLWARKKIEEYSKTLEEKVKQRTFELSVLHDLSQQIGYTLDYKQLFNLITASLHNVVKYDICGSFLLKGNAGNVRIKLPKSFNGKIIEKIKRSLINAFTEISGIELDEGKLNIEVDALAPSDTEHLQGEIRSFFNIPMIVKSKPIGMINISSLKENAFTQDHIRVLYTIANQASVAIGRLQALLASEKTKIHASVESMADGVIMIDKDKKVAVINPAAKKALQLDSSQDCDVDFEGISKLFGYDPAELLRKEGKASVKNEISIYHVPYQAQVSSVLGSEDEVLGTVVALRDISREKEIDRMKSEFISIVGHELRTPLTSIKNAVDIILGEKAGDINENQMRFLSMADRNINRLSGIISDLLDISKIESGRIKIELKPLDLCVPLDMAITSLTPGAGEKSISIRKEIPSDLPQAYGDPDKLEQIFINLIDNAIKFTFEGGRVCVSARLVQRSEVGGRRSDGDFMEISVTDTGMGIGPDNTEKVFDRFYQVEKALTRGIQGTGLGLSIVKGLVEAHGGKIWVESKVGKG
ncbi:MAG: CBS domain-containing protein, partial [Deltaproteobacteria bacterium]|nr:CBS domain-containing protein [Deltaproteobacteria bacterium]